MLQPRSKEIVEHSLTVNTGQSTPSTGAVASIMGLLRHTQYQHINVSAADNAAVTTRYTLWHSRSRPVVDKVYVQEHCWGKQFWHRGSQTATKHCRWQHSVPCVSQAALTACHTSGSPTLQCIADVKGNSTGMPNTGWIFPHAAPSRKHGCCK